jgi:hypothetical protein
VKKPYEYHARPFVVAFPRPSGGEVRLWFPETDRWERYGPVRGRLRYLGLLLAGKKGNWVP